MSNQILEENGWEVECESPLEIRHSDGSFASGQAALIVRESLTLESRSEKLHQTLLDIAATAGMAKNAAPTEFEKGLWREVHARSTAVISQ